MSDEFDPVAAANRLRDIAVAEAPRFFAENQALRGRIRELERDLRGAVAIITREGNRNDELNRVREQLRVARNQALEEAATLCDGFDERECCSSYCAGAIRELKADP